MDSTNTQRLDEIIAVEYTQHNRVQAARLHASKLTLVQIPVVKGGHGPTSKFVNVSFTLGGQVLVGSVRKWRVAAQWGPVQDPAALNAMRACPAPRAYRTMADIGGAGTCGNPVVTPRGYCRRHDPETMPLRDAQGRIVKRS